MGISCSAAATSCAGPSDRPSAFTAFSDSSTDMGCCPSSAAVVHTLSRPTAAASSPKPTPFSFFAARIRAVASSRVMIVCGAMVSCLLFCCTAVPLAVSFFLEPARALDQKMHHVFPDPVVLGIFDNGFAPARARDLHVDDLGQPRRRPVGHERDPVREENRLVD